MEQATRGRVVKAQRQARARQQMVAQLAARGVRDRRVLEALGQVERHRLLPEAFEHRAYEFQALPIGEGQTISSPDIVALSSEALALRGHETVLEVGTGSAYQAIVLSHLCARVITIERLPALARQARQALDALGVRNVAVCLGDGTRGRVEYAPYDAIVVTAGGPVAPPPLLDQLARGGRLVGPFGPMQAQRLLRIEKDASGQLQEQAIADCRFVALIGEYGWQA